MHKVQRISPPAELASHEGLCSTDSVMHAIDMQH